MSLESHGNGFSGRVDGQLFDARLAVMAIPAIGGIGEAIQTEAEGYAARGEQLPVSDSLVGQLFEAVATNPLDNKALGLAAGVIAASSLIQASRSMRQVNFENLQLVSGVDRLSAVEPLRNRAATKVKHAGLTAVAGVAAYKVGENLDQSKDIIGAMIGTGFGISCLLRTRKRFLGRY